MKWLLISAVLLTAFAQIAATHWHRDLLQEWQQLDKQRAALANEYTRLVLEHGTLTAHGRIDRLARERLTMVSPTIAEVMRP